MPQPLVWKASWIKFTFIPSQQSKVIHDFLNDFGPYDFMENERGMSVKFTDPDVEEDFVKTGARKARMEIADGITLLIKRPKKDQQLFLNQQRTQIAHEAATAISQDPGTLEAMGEFFRESDFTRDDKFCTRREDDGDALESVIEALVKLPPLELPSPEDIEIPDPPCLNHDEFDKKLKEEAAKASSEDKIFTETIIAKMYEEFLKDKNTEKMSELDLLYENNNEGFSTKPSWSKNTTRKTTAAQL